MQYPQEYITETPREEIDKMLLSQRLDEVLNTLLGREKKVLELRFFERMTFKQIGLLLRLTSSRVAQICNKALRKMRHPVRSERLYEFLDDKELEYRLKLKQKETPPIKKNMEQEETISETNYPEDPPHWVTLEYARNGTPYLGIPVSMLHSFKGIDTKTYQRWLDTVLERERQQRKRKEECVFTIWRNSYA